MQYLQERDSIVSLYACLGSNTSAESEQRPKRRSDSTAEGPLLSPSSSITQGTALRQTSPIRGSTEDTYESETPPQYTPQGLRRDSSNVAQYPSDRYNSSRPTQTVAIEDSKQEVRPFFAGESEGLEFLFDLCAPDRPARGLHYATPAQRYRAKRPNQKPARPLPPAPPIEVQRELVRCFFLHVWPVLPVVDAKEFLTSFYSQEPAVSPLLLWSVFFAAVSVSLQLGRTRLNITNTSSLSIKKHSSTIDCLREKH